MRGIMPVLDYQGWAALSGSFPEVLIKGRCTNEGTADIWHGHAYAHVDMLNPVK